MENIARKYAAERMSRSDAVGRNICRTCGEYEDDCVCGDAAAKLAKWEAYPQRFICPDCGFGVKADEDGCCATCGRDCALVAVLVEPEEMSPSVVSTSEQEKLFG